MCFSMAKYFYYFYMYFIFTWQSTTENDQFPRHSSRALVCCSNTNVLQLLIEQIHSVWFWLNSFFSMKFSFFTIFRILQESPSFLFKHSNLTLLRKTEKKFMWNIAWIRFTFKLLNTIFQTHYKVGFKTHTLDCIKTVISKVICYQIYCLNQWICDKFDYNIFFSNKTMILLRFNPVHAGRKLNVH